MRRTNASAVRRKPTRGFHVDEEASNDTCDQIYVRDGFHLERCKGEAHRNAHIDNCGVCALWGWMLVPDAPANERIASVLAGEKPRQLGMLAPPLSPQDEPTSDDRCTPPEVIGALLTYWPGGIDLDPCSNPWSQVPAKVRIDRAGDSLALPSWREAFAPPLIWSDLRSVYCNPPYSAPHAFVRRCRLTAEQGAEVIALVRHDSTTDWWHDIRDHADAHCQPSTRLRFRLAGEDTGPSDHASTIVLWLPPMHDRATLQRLHAFRKAFASIGEVLFPALVGMVPS